MGVKHEFDPIRHLYTSNGRILASVSAVIDSLDVGKFSHIPPSRLKAAAERGTLIHKMCEAWDLHRMIRLPEQEILTDELAGYLMAYQLFCEEYKPQWSGVEHRIFNDNLGLAGTIDRVGSFRNVPMAIVDIKTPYIASPFWQLQTAGYKVLKTGEDPQYAAARRFTIQLRPNGRYVIDEHNDQSDIVAFKAQLTVINWFKNQGIIS